MRLIDVDALKERILRFFRIKTFDDLLPEERAIVHLIDHAPTIEPERTGWIPCKEQLPKKSGYCACVP